MDDLIRRKDAYDSLLNGMVMTGYQSRALDCIAEYSIPAVDAVEVVHGEWIGYPECLKYVNAYSDDHLVCSACEECFSFLDNDMERFDYCPHCGARMDGRREEEHNAAD